MNQLPKLIEQSKLSPPFTKDDVGYIYDANMNVVAQMRGWGHFQYLPDAEKLQNEFAQFIVDAMNEKLASRPACGEEQRLFLNEVEKLGYQSLDDIDKLKKKLNFADDLAELTYNFATGKSNGDEIVKYVEDALDKI